MPGAPLLYLEDNPEAAIARAVDALREAGVVVFPTDTVYGMLAALGSKAAYQRIFELKQRPHDQPLQILTLFDTTLAQDAHHALDPWPDYQAQFTSGQATVVLDPDCFTSLPSAIRRIQPGTVGLRLPAFRPLQDLLACVSKQAVWATSVNRTGEPPVVDSSSLAVACSGWLKPVNLAVTTRASLSTAPSSVLLLTASGIKQLRG